MIADAQRRRLTIKGVCQNNEPASAKAKHSGVNSVGAAATKSVPRMPFWRSLGQIDNPVQQVDEKPVEGRDRIANWGR